MKFTLLKRTYPISQIERECDGFKFIMDNTTEEERKLMGIQITKQTIMIGEKYMYQVAKEDDKLLTRYISLENFEIIRKKIYGENDD